MLLLRYKIKIKDKMSLLVLSNLSKHSLSRMAARSMSSSNGFNELQNFVNGERSNPINSKTICDNVNPATGKVFGKFGLSNKDDVDLAVQSCSEAFESWKETTSSERAAILRKAARIVEENKDDIAVIETIDTGMSVFDFDKI